MEKYFSMRKKSPWKKVFLLLFIVLCLSATAIYVFNAYKKPPEKQVSVTIKTPKTLEKDAVIRIKYLFTCGHTKNEIKKIDSSLYKKTKEEIKAMHPEWIILKFTPVEIDVEQDMNTECEKHFIIKLNNDTLKIYKANNLDNFISEKKINKKALSQSDIKTLSEGIRADTELELLEILESFS